MPISIVVGGQFGSEGKGKVACFLAKERRASIVVRVGGPNSGHTVVDGVGCRRIFRQLPTAAILDDVVCVLSAGTYIDLDVLRAELKQMGLSMGRVKIDPHAVVITSEFKERERDDSLRERVGSTLTGTGAAVCSRAGRSESLRFAKDEPELREFLLDTVEFLDGRLKRGDRIIAEGSQGYGLSVIHTPYYPFATSRDTTAAGVLSEVGLSPLAVDEIALVLRAFPIRVPGNSGPLPNETTWEALARDGGFASPFSEVTSVTQQKRRVAHFDAEIVRAAIRANSPTSIFLNHVDYLDAMAATTRLPTKRVSAFVDQIQSMLGTAVDFIGLGPEGCLPAWPQSTRKLVA